MSKLFVQNLSLIITDKCNFNCAHCMKGIGNNCDMSIETINNIFDQIQAVGNLCICGGEPLMKPEIIKNIFQTIVDKEIFINEYGLTTNGTHFNNYINELFEAFDQYVSQFSNSFQNVKRFKSTTFGYIDLSWDIYHQQQLRFIKESNENLYEEYMKNINNLINSKFFLEVRTLKNGIFNEGNAKTLNEKKVELQAYKTFICENDGMTSIGPIISISNDGMISECNGSFNNLSKNYNYGNVNTDSLIEVVSKRATKCKRLKQWDHRVSKEAKRYSSYK